MIVCVDCGVTLGSWQAFAHHDCLRLDLRDAMSLRSWQGAYVDPEIIARVIHEANRALQHALGDPVPSPHYDEAPGWQLTGLHEGVQAALDGAGPEELHELWLASKRADGWTYGPHKDPEAKTHPCLVAYDDLPAEQRAKNDLFAAIVSALR